ncbi:uncharacterized protein LOC127848841 [Dreissena polymorpha]|uniref:uncharacterized protein LOC127848841 n=1 Tax=Dreissena polymorpha TaxID=45954 RepID=UPI00226569E1|nr:uncharacterized protein LOC127848841 [Dreissena polymorpha]
MFVIRFHFIFGYWRILRTYLKMSKVLCPVLVEEVNVITLKNMDSLLLSTYSRLPGTQVRVKCLSELTHSLIGRELITCLPSGQWNAPLPKCIKDTNKDNMKDIIFAQVTPEASARTSIATTDLNQIPLFLTLGAVGIICILLIGFLLYALYRHKQVKKRLHGTSDILNTSRSSNHNPSSSSEFWMELPGPRHFLCREVSFPEDTVTDNYRYTNLYSGWSGY